MSDNDRMSETRDGIIVVDKPAGLTSHDVVRQIRRITRTRKVGHAGTLDPMATGVLLVGVGRATRLLHHLLLTDKAYTATIRLGQATSTDDAEGEIVSETDASGLGQPAVAAAVASFVGNIEQVPATISAIKVDGQRAHALARSGADVELAARPITVTRFDMLDLRPSGSVLDVDVVVECSSGTYVRALARDIGRALDVGGHLTALRRTRVGPFGVDQAVGLAALAERSEPLTMTLAEAIRAAMPVRVITEAEATTLSYGQFLPAVGIAGTYGVLLADDTPVGLLREFDSGTKRGGGFFARPVLMWRARS
jgi:tRNA pseudouridine55 synthase